MLKLGDCLDDKLKVPAGKTQEEAAGATARDEPEDQKRRQRQLQPDGVAAWKALVGKHRRTDRPRF